MEYTIERGSDRKSVQELVMILDSLLRAVQNRRGSPKVRLYGYADYEGVPYAFLALEPNWGEGRRIFQMSLQPNGMAGIVYMSKWKEVSYGYSSMNKIEEVSLHDPDSIERIRGMIDKSCRVLANALASKARRKYEPSTAGRSRRPRMGRTAVRFASL